MALSMTTLMKLAISATESPRSRANSGLSPHSAPTDNPEHRQASNAVGEARYNKRALKCGDATGGGWVARVNATGNTATQNSMAASMKGSGPAMSPKFMSS